MLGLDPDTPDQTAPLPATQQGGRARYEETLSALIEAGLVKGGSVLHPTTPSYEASALVDSDGTLTVGGERHTSLSSAGRAVTGHSVNGWEFWGILSGSGELVPMRALRGPVPGDAPPAGAGGAPAEASGDDAGPRPTPIERPPSIQGTVDVFALLRASLLSVGDVLTARYKGTDYRATVRSNGHLSLHGRDYPSPTAAAVAITGGSVNGWQFWKVATGETLGSLRGRLPQP